MKFVCSLLTCMQNYRIGYICRANLCQLFLGGTAKLSLYLQTTKSEGPVVKWTPVVWHIATASRLVGWHTALSRHKRND